MTSSRLTFFKTSLNYLWFMGLAVYLSVMAGRAMLKNYTSKQEIEALEQRLVTLQLEKQRLEALLVYYKTSTYQEKELRRAMLLVRPGEKVYALPESGSPKLLEDEALTPAVATPKGDTELTLPIWRQWIERMFG